MANWSTSGRRSTEKLKKCTGRILHNARARANIAKPLDACCTACSVAARIARRAPGAFQRRSLRLVWSGMDQLAFARHILHNLVTSRQVIQRYRQRTWQGTMLKSACQAFDFVSHTCISFCIGYTRTHRILRTLPPRQRYIRCRCV